MPPFSNRRTHSAKAYCIGANNDASVTATASLLELMRGVRWLSSKVG